jgi:hypothetical protein
MKYAIFRTAGGFYGKVLDEEGNVLFETKTYKSRESVRQNLRRWIRQQDLKGNEPEEA